MRMILHLAVLMLLAEARAGEPLKQGVFNCEASNYRVVPLRVRFQITNGKDVENETQAL